MPRIIPSGSYARKYLDGLAEIRYRATCRQQPAQRLAKRVLVFLVQPGERSSDLGSGEGRAAPGGPGIRAEVVRLRIEQDGFPAFDVGRALALSDGGAGDPGAAAGPWRRQHAGRQAGHGHYPAERTGPAGDRVGVVARRRDDEHLPVLGPLQLPDDVEGSADRNGRKVVLRLAAERKIEDLGAVADRLDHLAGDRYLAADAVAVDGPVHRDFRGRRDLLDDPGHERTVTGLDVEIAVPRGQREAVQRIDVAASRDVIQPPVSPRPDADAGID